MPGYTNKGFLTYEELMEKYKCPSCKLLLRDAVQLLCGHLTCETCYYGMRSDSRSSCLRDECKDYASVINSSCIPDRLARRTVSKSAVICTYETCEWTGELQNRASHLDTHLPCSSATSQDKSSSKSTTCWTDVSKLSDLNTTKMESEVKHVKDDLRDLQNKVFDLKQEVKQLVVNTEAGMNMPQDGMKTWIINDYTKRYNSAKALLVTSLYCPQFYTGKTGYKICIRAYPNGDGLGFGSHLSLFISIQKGPFDNLLEWPFTGKVTFTLMNQAGGRHHTETFDTGKNPSSSFQKPVGIMNVASGCPKFILHKMLVTDGYMVDDTIIVTCKISMHR